MCCEVTASSWPWIEISMDRKWINRWIDGAITISSIPATKSGITGYKWQIASMCKDITTLSLGGRRYTFHLSNYMSSHGIFERIFCSHSRLMFPTHYNKDVISYHDLNFISVLCSACSLYNLIYFPYHFNAVFLSELGSCNYDDTFQRGDWDNGKLR